MQRLMAQKIFNLCIHYWGLFAIEHRHFLWDDVQGHHFVMLGQQHGIRQAHIASASNSNLHIDSNITFFTASSSNTPTRQGWPARYQ